ncbi:MAG TPA: Sec-independent protein translocase subunit TatA [Ornithinimicrobium sp.]|uniref:Sec-independent protein translocase subunit TatA n=1 Tax=Ornithinimicrobium sp. TaxID=1977084 RepID=UPI002B488E54|nr:Sec-independent protein translocase subunit TatA [Ornithinimicrobium sp.]HKJ12500.1 Sec-independent protein translocase subunit TatA [Ornithinimicrobium sp.]
MFRNMQGWQIVIIILALIILIGWKRLPDAARSLGRSMRIFKSEVEQMGSTPDEDQPSAASTDTVDSEPRRPTPARERSEEDHRSEEGHRSEEERTGETQQRSRDEHRS